MLRLSRMIKYALLLSLISLSSMAETLETTNSAQSAFETLEEMFSEARTTDMSEIEGHHSGRCFKYDPKKTRRNYYAENSALAAGYYLDGEGNGPLFPPTKVPYILSLYKEHEKVDYYDTMRQDDFYGLIASVRILRTRSTPPSQQEGSYMYKEASDENNYVTLALRVKDDYIIGQSLSAVNAQPDKQTYCYWFKKIKVIKN